MRGMVDVEKSIRQVRDREFGLRSLRLLTIALPVWAVLALVLLFLRHLLPDARPVLQNILIGSASAALIACLVYGLVGLGRARIAGLIDRRAALKDRLSNALEFTARDRQTPLTELAIADAGESAARLNIRPLAPVWEAGNGKRLALLVFLVPLLYVAAVVNLADFFRGEQEPAQLLGAVQPTMPAELADGDLQDLPTSTMLLPAVTGLRGLMGSWRERLDELRERAQAALSRLPQEEPELPEIIYPEDTGAGGTQQQQALSADGLPAVRPDSRMHLSDLAGLGAVDAEIDRNLKLAFAELDQDLMYEDPEIEEVESYVDQLRNIASNGHRTGESIMNAAGYGMQMSSNADPQGAFRTSTQGAQQQSFNEFLNEYAQHLQRIADKKREINQQRQAQGQQQGQGVLVSDQGQQVPGDAEMRMIRMTPEMQRRVKLTPEIGEHVAQPQEATGESPSRAGSGGGTFRGAIKVKHLDQDGAGSQETLTGQIGEGQSPVQFLEDNDEESLAAYNRAFNSFSDDAQQMLNDESVPVSIRSYVQRYLQSINPELFSGDNE